MRTAISGTQFRRDVKVARKRGKDMVKLRDIILLLIEGNPLPARYKDHKLGGDWTDFRECHIERNWSSGPLRQCWIGSTKPEAHLGVSDRTRH